MRGRRPIFHTVRDLYNRGMLRCVRLALLCIPVFAAAQLLPPPPTPPTQEKKAEQEQLPPEEDETALAPGEQYSFNPVKSKRDVEIGNQYFKNGKMLAAVNRFRSATKWNDGNVEAWVRLGDTELKRGNTKAAREAYAKCLELAPEGKVAGEVKKKLEKLKG